MDTYSGSNDSSYGPAPQVQWTDEDTASLAADLGDVFADEDFQAHQTALKFDDSEYFIPEVSFNAPQEVVPLPQIAPQECPEAYDPNLKLWYNTAPGPVTGAHYNRKIGWYFPMPAPETLPQGPVMTDHSTPIVAPVMAQDHVRAAGQHKAHPHPAVSQAAPARASAPKGRNPKKNSIIQRCSCKPQYSTIDVPRPPNQFICFRNRESMKVQREAEINEGVKIRHDEVSKRVAAKWNAMTPEEKAPYKAQADRLAAEHKIKYPGYVFKPGVKAAHQFGSISCTCGAYRINMAAREKRIANGETESPLKKKGRKPGRKPNVEPETLLQHSPYASASTPRKRKQRDEDIDEQLAPKRSTRAKSPVRYTESDDDGDSLFMPQGDNERADAPTEDDFDDTIENAPVLALPSKGRCSPPAPIATALASPPLTRSARKEPTPLKTGSLDSLFDFDDMLDYNAPFDFPTSARSSKKSSGKGSIAPITPRRSTRLSSKEAL